jgi:FkbM family methyltransferase
MISLRRFSQNNPLLRREKILRLIEDVSSQVSGKLSGVAARKGAWEALTKSGTVTATTNGFKEKYQVLCSDQVISRELFLKGEFDLNKLLRAHRYVKVLCGSVGSILIDVGANLGSICIPAVSRGLFAKATAIEANPPTAEVLRNNVRLNGLESRITVLQIVAGAPQSNPVAINHNDLNLGASSVVQDFGADHLLDVQSLDNVIPEVSNVGLIFMDVEGYEGNVLRGASILLRSGVPIALEFSPKMLRERISKEDFCHLVSDYSGFYSLNDPLRVFYSIEKISEVWDWYERELQGEQTDLIFLRRVKRTS